MGMTAQCRHCGVKGDLKDFQHLEGCLFVDLVQIEVNLDDIERVMHREKLEAYGVLKCLDKIREIVERRKK